VRDVASVDVVTGDGTDENVCGLEAQGCIELLYCTVTMRRLFVKRKSCRRNLRNSTLAVQTIYFPLENVLNRQ
jgi:hypothetical protein